jgi:hypothetical protein
VPRDVSRGKASLGEDMGALLIPDTLTMREDFEAVVARNRNHGDPGCVRRAQGKRGRRRHRDWHGNADRCYFLNKLDR